MLWLLILVLAAVAVLVSLAVLVLAASLGGGMQSDRTLVECEVLRAERRLHDVAASSFQSMLDVARMHRGNG